MKFRNKQNCSEPFNHYTFTDFFCERELAQYNSIDVSTAAAAINGARTTNTNRFFINEKNIHKSPLFGRIIDFFTRDEIIDMFEKESGRVIRGNYLRVEFIEDKQSSWLEPHVDINEKIVSLLMYFNTTNESEDIGTSLYNSEKEFVTTVPYRNNTGFYFFPSDNTWHGLEPITIKEKRQAIMINYCTFETEFEIPQ